MKIWSDNQIAILKDCYPNYFAQEVAEMTGMSINQVYRKAASLRLKKSDEFRRRERQRQAQRLIVCGANNRFPRGHIPFNKGKAMSDSTYEKVAPTMFKKGNKPHNTKYDGYERVTKDGYVEVRVAGRFKLKHRVIWEQAFGMIPKGHIIIFKDGNSRNFAIQNLEMITMKENMLRNSSQRFGKEVFQIIQLRGVLNKKIKSKIKSIEDGKK